MVKSTVPHVDARPHRSTSRSLFNYVGADVARGAPCARQGCSAQAIAEVLLPRRVAERLQLCRKHATEAVHEHHLDPVLTDFQAAVHQTWMAIRLAGLRADEATFMRLLWHRAPQFKGAVPHDVRTSLRHLQHFGYCGDWRDPDAAPATSLPR